MESLLELGDVTARTVDVQLNQGSYVRDVLQMILHMLPPFSREIVIAAFTTLCTPRTRWVLGAKGPNSDPVVHDDLPSARRAVPSLVTQGDDHASPVERPRREASRRDARVVSRVFGPPYGLETPD